MHSGLQVGGLPRYPLTHEQTAWLFVMRHSLFGPQGEGTHGLAGGTSGGTKIMDIQFPGISVRGRSFGTALKAEKLLS